jgi:hypothetical protein
VKAKKKSHRHQFWQEFHSPSDTYEVMTVMVDRLERIINEKSPGISE